MKNDLSGKFKSQQFFRHVQLCGVHGHYSPLMCGDEEWVFFSFLRSFSPNELLFIVSCNQSKMNEA